MKQHQILALKVMFAYIAGGLLAGLFLTACGGSDNGRSAGATPAATVPARPLEESDLDKTINELMSVYEIPGVAVGVIKEGKPVYTKGFGLRNVQTSQAVTPDTQFSIGSITKSFTTLAIAQQVEAGKLAWDTPIVKYLPDFKLSDAKATAALTLRHLMSNTSGIPETELTISRKSRPELFKALETLPLIGQPGEKFEYCNLNFVIVGAVLEKVTGQTWENYVQTNILNPLGMKAATLDYTAMQQQPDYAAGHKADIIEGFQVVPYSKWVDSFKPAGSINASLKEMQSYALMQLNEGLLPGSDNKQLVGKSFLKELHTRQIQIKPGQNDAGLINSAGYAMGWINQEYQGQTVVAHNGGIDGFASYLTMLPASRSAVIILVNSEPGDPRTDVFIEIVRTRLLEWVSGRAPTSQLAARVEASKNFNSSDFKAKVAIARAFKPDPAFVKNLEGNYNGAVGNISVRTNGARLYVGLKAGVEFELVPLNDQDFIGNTGDVIGQVFTFKSGSNGQVKVYQDKEEIASKVR